MTSMHEILAQPILILCESSGVSRRAFEARGFTQVYSCDLAPAEDGSPRHLQPYS